MVGHRPRNEIATKPLQMGYGMDRDRCRCGDPRCLPWVGPAFRCRDAECQPECADAIVGVRLPEARAVECRTEEWCLEEWCLEEWCLDKGSATVSDPC